MQEATEKYGKEKTSMGIEEKEELLKLITMNEAKLMGASETYRFGEDIKVPRKAKARVGDVPDAMRAE